MIIINSSAPQKIKSVLNRCRALCGRKNKRIVSLSTVTAFLVGVVLISANYRVGYTVMVDDIVLGTVATKSEYYQVLDEVKEEVNTISDIEFEPVAEEEFSMEIVPVKSFTEKEELVENIKSTDTNMQPAYSITADGQFIVAVASEEDANKLIEEYLKKYDLNDENIEVSLGAEVKITQCHVPQDTIRDYSSAEELMVTASKDEPVIPIKTVEHVDANVEIPFETVNVDDDTVYQGQTRVMEEGVPGTKYLNAYITKINGVITMESTVESYVITEPVTEVVAVGTKELPPSVGTGEFIMPTSGRLTSPYGRRWGRTHAGIDVAATTGTPIYAADNGIIIESEYQSNGYGNIIKVDHQNGFVTYYAHCSELYAKVGDTVAKGDLIAAVGNTGRSTGPHLHFEIRKDGNHIDPFSYIK